MKKLIMLFVMMSLFIAPMLPAKQLYVSPVRTKVYVDNIKSRSIAKLRRNTKVKLLTKTKRWSYVRFGNKHGWVMNIFLSAKPIKQKISLLGSASKSARMHARKRASSNVTAASARGLLQDRSNVRAKQKIEFDPNPNILSKIEQYYISEEQLFIFLAEENIQ